MKIFFIAVNIYFLGGLYTLDKYQKAHNAYLKEMEEYTNLVKQMKHYGLPQLKIQESENRYAAKPLSNSKIILTWPLIYLKRF